MQPTPNNSPFILLQNVKGTHLLIPRNRIIGVVSVIPSDKQHDDHRSTVHLAEGNTIYVTDDIDFIANKLEI